MAKIQIPTPLRKFTGNRSRFETDQSHVNDALQELVEQYPELKMNLLDEKGEIRSFINIYVDEKHIKNPEKEETQLSGENTITIVPAIAGGNKHNPLISINDCI